MTEHRQEYEFDLPVGLPDAGGEVYRHAAIRKMRGHEEALLYDRALGPGDLVNHIIAGTLLRLGALELPGPDVVGRMYSADRNYLLLQIRRITLGDEMTASYTCPAAPRR